MPEMIKTLSKLDFFLTKVLVQCITRNSAKLRLFQGCQSLPSVFVVGIWTDQMKFNCPLVATYGDTRQYNGLENPKIENTSLWYIADRRGKFQKIWGAPLELVTHFLLLYLICISMS